MPRQSLGCGVLAACLLAVPAWPHAQWQDEPAAKSEPSFKDTMGTKKPEKTAPAEPMISIGAYGGKVLKVADDGKAFLLRVYGQTATPTYTLGHPHSC
jgi:hypothetical protein